MPTLHRDAVDRGVHDPDGQLRGEQREIGQAELSDAKKCMNGLTLAQAILQEISRDWSGDRVILR